MAFREFDYSKRHCWGPNIYGEYTVDGTLDTRCDEWRNHVEKAGNVEFMRWMQEFNKLTDNKVIGTDSPDGNLKLGKQWCDTYKMEMYCEDYGGRVKCFLDVKNEVALVEIHDDSLLDAAEQATILVNKQYEDMLNVSGNPA